MVVFANTSDFVKINYNGPAMIVILTIVAKCKSMILRILLILVMEREVRSYKKSIINHWNLGFVSVSI
jgi:hypothetical protein